ncbi:hypothetical protein GCM10023094_27430 [Rhodococcus olei]|uniref:DUF2567 domain-containing protein n=1 Tax=Rhodococcus olei TaxID=2161675 RepID=A0ABP8P5P2_9NOCA
MTTEIAPPEQPPVPAARRRRTSRAEVRSAARVVVGVVVVSALAGIAWGLLVPAQHFLVVSGGGAVSLTGESDHQFDAVALLMCLGVILGVLAAVAVWTRRAVRGVPQLIGLLIGSAVGAAASALVGLGVAQLRFPTPDDVEIGRIVAATPGLGTTTALVVQPLVATLTYLLLVSLSPDPALGHTEAAEDPAADAAGRPASR